MNEALTLLTDLVNATDRYWTPENTEAAESLPHSEEYETALNNAKAFISSQES